MLEYWLLGGIQKFGQNSKKRLTETKHDDIISELTPPKPSREKKLRKAEAAKYHNEDNFEKK